MIKHKFYRLLEQIIGGITVFSASPVSRDRVLETLVHFLSGPLMLECAVHSVHEGGVGGSVAGAVSL